MTAPIVVIGGGPAASAACGALREEGYDGPLVVCSAEHVAPYERPPLSKDLLTGQATAADLALRADDWYAANDIDLRLGTPVVALSNGTHEVELAGGERLAYDKVLLATGGSPRRLPDDHSDRVLYLRDLGDSHELGKRIRSGEPLVVLGGGFIGCEVAASARGSGAEVTVLEMDELPMRRGVGDAIAAAMAQVHRENGVVLRTGERVDVVESSSEGVRIRAAGGDLECATLLVAVGLVPNTAVLRGTGIDLDPASGGVAVDGFCRSSDPDVFAAGDVAAHDHPGYGRIRVEHHDNAIKQGAAAARAMLGVLSEPYAEPHWFWSDQFEHNLQSVGRSGPGDQQVVRGSIEERRFAQFSLHRGRVRSVIALDRGRDMMWAKKLVASGMTVDPGQLADDSVPLKQLVKSGGGAEQ
ncbi:NAD(P)/FAD-dependent oxidoreductase [Pseudonocardia endophytica]|uniref:3-phenylpropionate/trans-cinnamate dioxygenase ferredoxin reductase subunit n=1 Tax=Pseudonocardia endophytica TaxID=401976 RepID=A0A4R1I207_PSEEN|nr:FAD-dependent oxidoreductase [Pseudonocardia endophytica]TCK27625.1 3-phenylpropionate/trans-cinnamate dioxygenase ferredoxin reductase subunit [Pseudonocardia endophytica]